ncbi:hypothetical protein [Clostridium botulinum]|uniref:hypothetical protein n=1 Tax=Clostridium botulinum TaxID=1491 RepID=UPI00217DFC64|nr:hypothetical protein [Clostridium botulinum]
MSDYGRIINEFITLKNEIYKEINELNGNSKLISFRYLLPYRVPVKNGERIIFKVNTHKSVLITFTHKELDVSKEILMNEKNYTFVECTSIITKKNYKKMKESREGRKKEAFSKLFDEQIKVLNNFINIIIMKHQYHNIFVLTLRSILTIPTYIIYENNGNVIQSSIFLINPLSKVENDQKSTLSYSELKNVILNYNLYLSHPSERYALIMRKGERAFFLSEYNDSIVYIQTSFEIFISDFVKKYYEINKLLDSEKIKDILDCGYKNIINDHLLKIIEKLNLEYKEEIINCFSKYKDDYYPMRNKIVHEGKSYKERDAEEFKEIVSNAVRLITYGMHKATNDSFVSYFTTYNILSEELDIESIKDKYTIP